MGVGINTGDCLVGNLGSSHRFNYSALGDAVNLSSRIESLSKHYGIPIIISESTRKLVPDFAAIELDAVAVVGKTEIARIYGLLGPPEEARTRLLPAGRAPRPAAGCPIAPSSGMWRGR
jgi:adenylate cyclase